MHRSSEARQTTSRARSSTVSGAPAAGSSADAWIQLRRQRSAPSSSPSPCEERARPDPVATTRHESIDQESAADRHTASSFTLCASPTPGALPRFPGAGSSATGKQSYGFLLRTIGDHKRDQTDHPTGKFGPGGSKFIEDINASASYLDDDNDSECNVSAITGYGADVAFVKHVYKSKNDDVQVDLALLLKRYADLDKALAACEPRRVQDANTRFVEQLRLAVRDLDAGVGDIRSTAGYDSALKSLDFLLTPLEPFYANVDSVDDLIDLRDMGYQLMTLAMSHFRSLLSVVVMEREHRRPGLSPQDVFGPLRRAMTRIENLVDLVGRRRNEPQAHWAKDRHSGAEDDDDFTVVTRGEDEDEDLCDPFDSAYDALLASMSADFRSGARNARDSLAVFPNLSSSIPNAELPTPPEDELDVIVNLDGSITAATLKQIVRILTDRREVLVRDVTELTDLFFMFFRKFTPPKGLFKLLVERYNEQAPKELDASLLPLWRLHAQFSKIQVAKLLYLWCSNYWKGATDQAVVKSMTDFIFGTLAKDKDLPLDTAKRVSNALLECCCGRADISHSRWLAREVKLTQQAAAHYEPTAFAQQLNGGMMKHDSLDFNLLDIAVFWADGGFEELARQLTVSESDYFHAFLPQDLIEFRDASLQHKLNRWRSFTNAISLWVTKTVVEQRKITYRARVVKLFVQTAAACKNLRNFNSAYAILLGLQASAVTRLRRTEELLDERTVSTRESLGEFFNGRDWRLYRHELPVNLPAIPLSVMIPKEISPMRECMQRVDSTVGPPTAPVEGMIPLKFYRHMRRIVRDLEKCYGRHKLTSTELVRGWLEHHLEPLMAVQYDKYSQTLFDKSQHLEVEASTSEEKAGLSTTSTRRCKT